MFLIFNNYHASKKFMIKIYGDYKDYNKFSVKDLNKNQMNKSKFINRIKSKNFMS